MKVLDLFAGIGGFSLGLEWASPEFETVAFCEIDDYARRVLEKNWPGVPVYGDIRELTAERLRRDGILADSPGLLGDGGQNDGGKYKRKKEQQPGNLRGESGGGIDIITGGFPCQDLSNAGKGAGIEAERSGLWSELCRITGEIRPRYAIFENVSALLSGDDGRWHARVLGDLAAIGFDAEWHCISAAHVGAPHIRDRWWCVAYPARVQQGRQEQRSERQRAGSCGEPGQVCEVLAYPQRIRQQGQRQHGNTSDQAPDREGQTGNAVHVSKPGQWLPEPGVGRVANGVPSRVDRLKCLGNAIVPQIAEMIGRAILEREHEKNPETA